jgi:hypothetical protein
MVMSETQATRAAEELRKKKKALSEKTIRIRAEMAGDVTEVKA